MKGRLLIIFALSALPCMLSAQVGSGIRYDTIRTQTTRGSGIRYDTIRGNNNTTERIRTFDEFRRQNSGQETRGAVQPAPQNARARRQAAKSADARKPATGRSAEKADGWKSEGRWQFGGGVGFSWGSSEWSIQLSPQIGYRVARMLVLGGGVTYGYFEDRVNYYYEGHGWSNYKANMIGVNGLAQFTPSRYVNLFMQPEVTCQWARAYGERVESDPVFSLPVGVGFMLPVWRGGITLSFYYDVVQNRYSPYGNRVQCSVGYLFTW